MWVCAFGCNFGKKMEKINLLKQQELDSRHANTTATQRTRVDKRVFWPQYFGKIEYVCLIGFRLT